MPNKPVLSFVTSLLVCWAPAVLAQQAAQNFPDGPGKDTVLKVCGGCHDINRARAGYTPEGWNTLQHMMQNFDTPIPAGGMAHRYRLSDQGVSRNGRVPPAVIIEGPVQASIKLWNVPTLGSRPHDPVATKDGAIWWTGQLSNKLGRVDIKTGAIREYTLKTPHTGPHGLRRGQGRQHLVHRQPCRADRQARSEDRPGHRIQDAGSRR